VRRRLRGSWSLEACREICFWRWPADILLLSSSGCLDVSAPSSPPDANNDKKSTILLLYYYIVHLYSPSNNKIVSNALYAYFNETGMFLRHVWMRWWKLSSACCKEESSSCKGRHAKMHVGHSLTSCSEGSPEDHENKLHDWKSLSKSLTSPDSAACFKWPSNMTRFNSTFNDVMLYYIVHKCLWICLHNVVLYQLYCNVLCVRTEMLCL